MISLSNFSNDGSGHQSIVRFISNVRSKNILELITVIVQGLSDKCNNYKTLIRLNKVPERRCEKRVTDYTVYTS